MIRPGTKVAAVVGIGVAILGALAVSFAHSGEPGETADPLPPATAAPAT